MSERVDECRRKVLECRHYAASATDLGVRLMYLDLARQWQEIAAQFELLDSQAASQSTDGSAETSLKP
jgi:hypothetical protein